MKFFKELTLAILILFNIMHSMECGEAYPLDQTENDLLVDSALDLHNQFRARHGSPPLVKDANATAYALERALTIARSGLGRSATYVFYNEKRFYNYTNPKLTWHNTHFTQLVWRATTKYGAAVVMRKWSRSDVEAPAYLVGYHCLYMLFAYNPPGNVISGLAANISPPSS